MLVDRTCRSREGTIKSALVAVGIATLDLVDMTDWVNNSFETILGSL